MPGLNTDDPQVSGVERKNPDPSMTPTSEQSGGAAGDAGAMTAPGSPPGPVLDMTPDPNVDRRLVGPDGDKRLVGPDGSQGE
jgi:hypothetical protein